jgi:hypothetical protein
MNGQSYNRYSYVMNNPTNFTDPTGFSACGEKTTGSNIAQSCSAEQKETEKLANACAGGCNVKVTMTDGSVHNYKVQPYTTASMVNGTGVLKTDPKNKAPDGSASAGNAAKAFSNDDATIGPVPPSRWTDTFLGRMISDTFGKAGAFFTEGNRNPLTDQAENFSGDKKAEALIMMLPMARGAQAEKALAKEVKELTYVLGRQVDTNVAKDWANHTILDIKNWTLAKNDAWMANIIDKRASVYLASPQTNATLWDSVNNRMTVFARELDQLRKAGYKQIGDYMHPPPKP